MLKSKSATKCQRGSHQFRGLALVTVVLAVAAAVTNMRNLRSWHTDTGNGDPNHPLLLPDGPFFGFAELDAAGAAAIDAECAPRHQAADADELTLADPDPEDDLLDLANPPADTDGQAA